MLALKSLGAVLEAVAQPANLVTFGGTVVSAAPNMLTVRGLSKHISIGELVQIGNHCRGEVVRIGGEEAFICPFDDEHPGKLGDMVFPDNRDVRQPTSDWLGRVLDALGDPLDGKPAPLSSSKTDTGATPRKRAGVLDREKVEHPLKTGVKLIDIFTPICRGQRLGIFAGSGVGKSTLLSMLTRSDAFDVVVVALVGERGREVREFLEDSIGPEEMKKTVAIVATSDDSPMLRRRAPELALDVAESFSQDGKNVLLLVDSLTRYAHSLREIGVAHGEPPIARGYPASVFSQLPKLLERAGPGAPGTGSITAITTVLVDGDDHNDPISDAVRGIIDGHLVLDRWIAEEGRYPPINPLSSISRLSNKAWSSDERELVLQLRKLISRFEETRDLRMLGGWRPGGDPELDKAVETVPRIYEGLCQTPDQPLSASAFDDLVAHLKGAQHENAGHVETTNA